MAEEPRLIIKKDDYDDMIFHAYHTYSESYPKIHDFSIHNDCFISLLPMKYLEELRDLACGEVWEKKIKLTVEE